MPTFSTTDLLDLAQILRDAARTEIMPRFRRLEAEAVRSKTGPLDLVTDADEAAERMIEAGLHRRFPGCAIVGEEAASADPAITDRLAGADLAFIVDPVDGTANYAAGLPLFGTMAAATVRGEIVAGVIYDPMGDDTALALRGEGAWIDAADGTRLDLRVADPCPVRQMSGSAGWRNLPDGVRMTVLNNLPRVAASWDFRCAAHSYRLLAGGHCHYMLFTRLLPWDHAPGWLLHQEAGGYSARLDGTPYRATDSSGGLLCTPDRESWDALKDALFST